MATYVVSDIHGQYDKFINLINKINLQDSDDLYVLGDVVDRGPHPIKTLRKLMEMPNVICLVGNHDLMALECLEFLMQEITDDTVGLLDGEMMDKLIHWNRNGSKTTIDEFGKLDTDEKKDVIEFIKNFSIYEELEVAGKEYLLVHGGLGNFSPEKDIEDYSLYDIVWSRADYRRKYFDDIYLVTGHTPTQTIKSNPRPGYIYRANNHIAIDCGACFDDGRLAAICLETGEEFYSN